MTDARKRQPALSELMARFLRQTSDHISVGDVVPYEAVPVQPVDARLAWNEAGVAVQSFGLPSAAGSELPQDWATLVAGYEPVAAVACCAGNFPQLVRDVHGLLKADDLSTLCATSTRPLPATGLVGWARQLAQTGNYADILLATGVCRVARHYDEADTLLKEHRAGVPPEWQAAWANEEAALAWHRGNFESAARLWQGQAASAPVLFNQGMAALFLGRPKDARRPLEQSVSQFSEDGGWHHLGRLYLALAEIRS